MVIVEVADIPKIESITDVPMDNPMQVFKVCRDLEDLCIKNNGIGISAVQAGIPWRLFLVKGDGTCPVIPRGKFGYFANCSYKKLTEEQVVSLEGCLSIRSQDGRLRSFQIERYLKININGFRLCYENGLYFEELDCSLSVLQQGIVFQHEIQHHQGILISDIGKEIFIW